MHCWLFSKNASFTNASLLQVIVCHPAMSGTLSSMTQEKAMAPRLAFSTVEIVDLIQCIVVASLSSTRCKTSCGICGGHDRRSVYNTAAIVWCMLSHIALDCLFLLVVGMSLIPRTPRRLAKANPVNSLPLSWTTHAGRGYWVNQVFSNFLAMTSLALVMMHVSSTRWMVVSMHVKA